MELDPVRDVDVAMNGAVKDPLYDQESLKLGKDDIRVLILLPGPSQRRLVIANGVQRRTSPQCSPYTAVSYVWGTATKPKLIHCNSIPVYVTRNLYSALIYLRGKSRPTVLWVDAICINQRDNNEKGVQVQRMGDIYRQSARTIAWLGKGTILSHLAFTSCRALADERRRTLEQPDEAAAHTNSETATTHSFLQRLIEIVRPERLWRLGTMMHLLRRPYFTRVWIIQEIALSPILDLACGNDMIPFVDFSLAAIDMLASQLGGRKAAHLARLMTARSLLSSTVNKGPSDLPSLASVFGLLAQDELWIETNILTLLTLFRDSVAALDVDKVYSLIGLGQEIERGSTYGIQVLYPEGQTKNTATEETYVRVARIILSHQNSLRLFGAITHQLPLGGFDLLNHRIDAYFSRSRSRETVMLPTWVPDWRNRGSVAMPILLPSGARFRATRGVAYNFAASNHSATPYWREIKLSGHLLFYDGAPVTISSLGSVCETEKAQSTIWFRLKVALTLSSSYRLQTIRAWSKAFDNRALEFRDEFIYTITCGRGDKSNDGSPLLATAIFGHSQRSCFLALPAFLQAIYAYIALRTLYLVFRPSAKQLWFVCLNWAALLMTLFFVSSVFYRIWPNLSMGNALAQLMVERLYAIEARRLARLSSGCLALVPKTSQDGDVVALCRGGEVPLLLRERGEYFEMVGECYVHKAMDGSQFQEDKCHVIPLV
ncbi:HET-6OR heterokaryon incompatibility protein (het-6OR allele) [Fusarium austroafricanum]|uniref:HET-6OR heterokaryon incompatibility protein (Het-6OR allele) n=1 Tax=Fusarium austroafricanum TaxID=2364996 RepID=A0A8H4NX44_9HYPO|nr:HET-6OR heterokaryon incompatibility protein (het-6OR allele) [Fusarium austroafricanum]